MGLEGEILWGPAPSFLNKGEAVAGGVRVHRLTATPPHALYIYMAFAIFSDGSFFLSFLVSFSHRELKE